MQDESEARSQEQNNTTATDDKDATIANLKQQARPGLNHILQKAACVPNREMASVKEEHERVGRVSEIGAEREGPYRQFPAMF